MDSLDFVGTTVKQSLPGCFVQIPSGYVGAAGSSMYNVLMLDAPTATNYHTHAHIEATTGTNHEDRTCDLVDQP